MTAYRIQGTTDDVTACQRLGCPRDDLRVTVVLAVLDAGGNRQDLTYFGTDCAAKALGFTQTELKAELRAIKAATRTAQQRQRADKSASEDEAFAAWAAAMYGVAIDRRPQRAGATVGLRDAVFNALHTIAPARSPYSFVKEFRAAG